MSKLVGGWPNVAIRTTLLQYSQHLDAHFPYISSYNRNIEYQNTHHTQPLFFCKLDYFHLFVINFPLGPLISSAAPEPEPQGTA
jgi:hypothetical protein